MISILIKVELFKIFSKWRTYIGFIAIGILFPIILYLIKWEGGSFIEHRMRSIGKDFLISGNIYNVWVVTEFIMNSLWVHVPFLIVLVSGDLLSGEATAGTFRLSLIRPITRGEFLVAKYISNLIYVASLIIFMFAICVGLGYYFFGSGDLISFNDGVFAIIPESEAPLRVFLAFILAIISMWVVASLAFLFSSFVENAIGPIISSMVIIFSFLILSNLPFETMDKYKPLFFTTYSSVWTEVFHYEIDFEKIKESVLMLFANIVILFSITFLIFQRKDIRS